MQCVSSRVCGPLVHPQPNAVAVTLIFILLCCHFYSLNTEHLLLWTRQNIQIISNSKYCWKHPEHILTRQVRRQHLQTLWFKRSSAEPRMFVLFFQISLLIDTAPDLGSWSTLLFPGRNNFNLFV